MALVISTEGQGVLFNGALAGKEGWTVSTNGVRVSVTNAISGLSGSSLITEAEVDGSTFADFDGLAAALGTVLFKSGGEPGPGPEPVVSVTGDGVDNTDPTQPVISYPTPGDIGAATAAQGSLADSAVQPGDLPAAPTWTTISGKPAFVAEGATAAAARTALGLGTAATTASTAYATAAQGSTADTALQPGYLESLTGYDAGAVQTLKNNSGTLEWVTD